MKKLARVLQVLEPGRDGVFHFVEAFVEFLHRRHPEITVDLAFSSLRGGESLTHLVDKVRAAGGMAIDLKVGNAPQLHDFQATREIATLVKARKPQIIHAHSSKAGGLTRLMRLLVPGMPPTIYSPHAYYGISGQKSLKTLFFNLIEGVLGRIGVTATCSMDERQFALHTLHIPPRRLISIYNGIDLNRFKPVTTERKNELRREFGLPEDTVILVTIGADRPQKNYGPLYEAINNLLGDSVSSLHLVHCGNGAAELVRRHITNSPQNCTTYSFVHEIELILQASDGFILTSRYEGLSLAVLNALCVGLKMFLTRVKGNRGLEKLGFDEIVWLEPIEEPIEMTKRIETALRAWLVRPLMAGPEQAKRSAQQFNSEVQYEKFLKAYVSQIKE